MLQTLILGVTPNQNCTLCGFFYNYLIYYYNAVKHTLKFTNMHKIIKICSKKLSKKNK